MEKLEAINYVLSMLGDTDYLEAADLVDPHPDVAAAITRIDEATTTLLTRGWYFNTVQRTYTPDAMTNQITVTDVIKVLPGYTDKAITVKNSLLYIPADDTDEFSADLTVCVVLDLPFEDLPQTAAEFVKQKASQTAVKIELEDIAKADVINEELMTAWTSLLQEQAEQTRLNKFNSPGVLRARSRVKPYRRANYNQITFY